MKRSMLLILAMACAGLFPVVSQGQTRINSNFIGDDDGVPPTYDSIPPQRIGLPPSEMELSSNGSGSVEGLCFDEYLIAPTRVMSFPKVLSGNQDATVRFADGSTMGLQEAINNRKVSVHAVQLTTEFRNETGAPMHISITHPVVLWDRPGGEVNPDAMAFLEPSNQNGRSQQENVWSVTTAERNLKVLGYYDGSVWNIDRDVFRRATTSFQSANGISPDGNLSGSTISRLASISNELSSRLRRLGMRDRERHSLKEDLASQIRAYERSMGRAPTGAWSPDLAGRLTGDEGILQTLYGLQTKDQSVADLLGADGVDPSVATFLNARGGTMFLVESARGVELWNRKGGNVTFEGRGKEGVLRMDAMAASLASKASKSGRLVIYPRVGSSNMTALSFGNRTIQLNRAGLDQYLNGGEIPAALADVITPYLESAGSEPTGRRGQAATFIVYRGPFAVGRGGDIASATGHSPLAAVELQQADATKLAAALQRSYGDKIDLYMSDDLEVGAYRLGAALGLPPGDLMLPSSGLFALSGTFVGHTPAY